MAFFSCSRWNEVAATSRAALGPAVSRLTPESMKIMLAIKGGVELQPIRHDPDKAGLIGCIHLAPSWIFSGHDSIPAVDIGGSNIRVGTIDLNQSKATDLSRSKVGSPSCGDTRVMSQPEIRPSTA